MPKTKFEDAIYTIIMATIMVYGMIVYNVALNTGGVSGQTFLLATHEMIIMVPVAFVLEFSLSENCSETRIHRNETYRSSTVHHLCHFYLHLLHYVSDHEPGCHHSL